MSTQTNSTPVTTAEAPDKGVGCDALLGRIERERIKVEAACAARSLGIAKEWAELMAKFEKAKAQP